MYLTWVLRGRASLNCEIRWTRPALLREFVRRDRGGRGWHIPEELSGTHEHFAVRFFLLLAIGVLAAAVAGFAQTGPYQGSASAGPPTGPDRCHCRSTTPENGAALQPRAELPLRRLRSAPRAQNIVARSVLFPNLSGGLRENAQQIDLQSFGFNFKFPASTGINFPAVVGPFNYFDLRAYLVAARRRRERDSQLPVGSRSAARRGALRRRIRGKSSCTW